MMFMVVATATNICMSFTTCQALIEIFLNLLTYLIFTSTLWNKMISQSLQMKKTRQKRKKKYIFGEVKQLVSSSAMIWICTDSAHFWRIWALCTKLKLAFQWIMTFQQFRFKNNISIQRLYTYIHIFTYLPLARKPYRWFYAMTFSRYHI